MSVRKLSALALPVAFALAACAVETAPAEVAPTEETGTAKEAICTPPLKPAVVEALDPTCGIQTIVSYTTSAGYTSSNCTGRAEIEATRPDPECPSFTLNSWDVEASPLDLKQIGTAAACTGSYVDYTIYGVTSQGVGKTLATGRFHGVWSGTACSLRYGQQFSSAIFDPYAQVFLSGDGYRDVPLLFGSSLLTPMNVTLQVRQAYNP